jgi:hypothetical protein
MPFGRDFPFAVPQGVYLAFSIDIAKTLANQGCDATEATCSELHHISEKTYVGFCCEVSIGCYPPSMTSLTCHSQWDHLPFPTNPVNQIVLRILQSQMTTPREEKYISCDMCAPVGPSTPHPLNREPVMTVPPLPWDICYHPTCSDVSVRVSSEERDWAAATRMKDLDFVRMKFMLCEDKRRRDASRANDQPEEEKESNRNDEPEDECDNPDLREYLDREIQRIVDESGSGGWVASSSCSASECDHAYSAEDVEDDEASTWSFSERAANPVEDSEAHEDGSDHPVYGALPQKLLVDDDIQKNGNLVPVVNITTDLSAACTLRPVDELYADLRELERLVFDFRRTC